MTVNYQKPASAYDVVIVGGGMVGSLLACALGGSALKVALVERQSNVDALSESYDLRVSALTLASRTMLESVGAWTGIVRRRHAGVAAMRVWDADGGAEIHFSARDIGEPYLAYVVENAVVAA